ncbi:MAG: collagenase [Anaerolineae bacterium]|nr:collagenase [Anaerolineae bacterium]
MKKTIKYLLAVSIVMVAILFLGFKKNIQWQGLHQYDTQHFTIYYEDLNQQTLKDIEQKLETNYPAIHRFFGLNDQSRGKVIVYQNVERFQRAYLGLFLSFLFGDWAAGAAYQDIVLIASPENPGSQHTYADMLDIAVHEYVHAQIYRLNENVDIWLDEGLATYLSGQKSALSPITAPTFEQMQSQSLNEFAENNGYAWSYAYVEYLVTTYGAEKVVDLVRTNDYEGCLGQSKLAIYQKWVDESGKLIDKKVGKE